MKYYLSYIHNRLNNDKGFPSKFERAIISAIDNHNFNQDFNLIYFTPEEVYICGCEIDTASNRFSVKDFSWLNHNLKEHLKNYNAAGSSTHGFELAFFNDNGVIVYDDYYNEKFPELKSFNSILDESLADLPKLPNLPVVICGEFCNFNALKYVLQKKYGKVITVKAEDAKNLKGRTLFSKDITAKNLSTSIPSKITSHLGTNFLEVFLPIHNSSLESIFWKETKWKDLLPEGATTCEINGVTCAYLRISFEIDAFNNVFCRFDDGHGHSGSLLINAPWGKEKISTTQQENSSKEAEIKREEKFEKPNVENKVPDKEKEAQPKDSTEDTTTAEREPEVKNVINQAPETVNTEIQEDKILSFTDIFTEKFVKETEEIQIQDSYIYLPHQFINLRDFILAVNTVLIESGSSRKLKRIKVETQKAEDIIRQQIKKNKGDDKIEESDLARIEQSQKRQEDEFERLKKKMKYSGIELEHSYRKFHDRKIEFSNGWSVKAGRGLDIFKRRSNEMEPKRCKDCNFIFTFGHDTKAVERNTRKID